MPNTNLQVPENPSKADARDALAVLLEPLAETPFAQPHDRAVAMAAILTTLARPSLPTAPMFLYNATVPGAGLTTIATITAKIGGHHPTYMSLPNREREASRAIIRALCQGSKVVLFDNLQRRLKSDVLCCVLTSPTFTARAPGKSNDVTISTNATIMATGININVVGDLVRRCLVCNLDPQCERPGERVFKRDPIAWVAEHRDELEIAGLTILRAWELAEEPKPELAPMCGFEEFSARVRGALIWLGMPDPCLGLADQPK